VVGLKVHGLPRAERLLAKRQKRLVGIQYYPLPVLVAQQVEVVLKQRPEALLHGRRAGQAYA
jgi:hypothetical protein